MLKKNKKKKLINFKLLKLTRFIEKKKKLIDKNIMAYKIKNNLNNLNNLNYLKKNKKKIKIFQKKRFNFFFIFRTNFR